MTPEQLELVASTAAVAEERSAEFASAFYAHLFGLEPELRALFSDDMAAQEAKLADEMVFFAEVASDLEGLVVRARQLGTRHRRYGVRADHYEPVEEALIAALRIVLDDVFTAEVATAWHRLYRLIAETMMEGAIGELFAER